MSFLDAGPRWFACFDQPDLKAPFEVEVRCDPAWTVAGNGGAIEIAPGHWRLAATKPLSTYFVTLIAGPYHSVRAEHDGIPLELHARASLGELLDAQAPEIFDITRRALDRYHELFGVRYPFGEYHQAFVPDFNAGAMENPGCVTFRDQFVFRSASTRGERAVRANVIAHEMAHMWFGDLVTMRWWDDLWLNESFAEYMAYRVCSEVTDYPSWAEFGIKRKDWGFVADQAPSTHPVAGNGSADAASALADFDGISYAKGAAVLRQLATFVGDDVFFTGLRAYFAEHAYGNAAFGDLLGAWVGAGAEGLPGWADAWLRTSGLDVLTTRRQDGRLLLARGASDGPERPHAVTVSGWDSVGHQTLQTLVRLDAGVPALVVDTDAEVSFALADSLDQTWAKIRFDGGFPSARAAFGRLTDVSNRVVVYNALRDAVRDAELDPGEALGLLLETLPTEPDDLVLAELLRFATAELSGVFTPAEARPLRRRSIADCAAALLDTATAGSDRQLVAARALVAAGPSDRSFAGWLIGDDVPPGLAIDAELRWAVVERLAAWSALDEADIASELEGDRSAAGVVHAARARAYLPTPEAKQAAWRLLVGTGATPAYELYAIAEAFFEPSQNDLTEPYVSRFLSEMPATASHRHGWSLSRIIRLAFPTSHAGEELLRGTDALIADPALDPAVRRSLVDAADVARRALRSIRRYATPGAQHS
jgi:aminopeptidase N